MRRPRARDRRVIRRTSRRAPTSGPARAVVLYTDGVIEARRRGELFGSERLDALLAEHAGEPAQAIADAVVDGVSRIRGRRPRRRLRDRRHQAHVNLRRDGGRAARDRPSRRRGGRAREHTRRAAGRGRCRRATSSSSTSVPISSSRTRRARRRWSRSRSTTPSSSCASTASACISMRSSPGTSGRSSTRSGAMVSRSVRSSRRRSPRRRARSRASRRSCPARSAIRATATGCPASAGPRA